jgi:opacity protein-like surface antigen
MKRVVMAFLMMVGLAGHAPAQDTFMRIPTGLMPGTPTHWNWSGFYFGGQMGAGVAKLDPGNATGGMVADILRNTTIENEAQVSSWPRLPPVDTSRAMYGGFIGYNVQWDDLILGVELNYNRGRFSGSSVDTIGRSYETSDEYFYSVNLSSQVDLSLSEYATIRARFGQVMGPFLPFGAIGFAVGKADIRRTVTVALTATDVSDAADRPPLALGPVTQTDVKNNAYIYGGTAGLGFDFALMQNVFVRAEYEYVRFFPFRGAIMQLHNARVGVGLKF